ncbi:glycosyltransferase family 2 protein [Sphingomonas sp. JC676]|uniref:glycosyltransferase family 2 protein n=1 Tax=Sphingomonas sp. JC676 TaxID=2768065 RepID=UPI0016584611|nr:glycosyltransferase family 2 protein [Sphingomonas sp. JC676]MBC9030941.1 glycosyltransferase family 2 protein [Sphingomonas sp. JC676]
MLSIFIPSFNHAPYVTEAIASARLIDVPGKHIYVIDDASIDNSEEVISAYLAEVNAEDVTFIRKSENKGVIDSMITFLNLCKTEYIYVVSSDDIAIPDGICELVRRLEESRTLQFIIGGGKNVLSDGRLTPIYGRKHNDLFRQSKEKFAESIFLMDSSPLLCQSSVFRASALRDVEAVVPDIVADDYVIFSKLFLRYMRKGIDYDFLPTIDCVYYRHHGNNSYQRILRQVATTLQVLEVVAPKHIRGRAIAYKLSFFTLISLRRRDFSSMLGILRLLRARSVPSFVRGLALNAYWWSKYR